MIEHYPGACEYLFKMNVLFSTAGPTRVCGGTTVSTEALKDIQLLVVHKLTKPHIGGLPACAIMPRKNTDCLYSIMYNATNEKDT